MKFELLEAFCRDNIGSTEVISMIQNLLVIVSIVLTGMLLTLICYGVHTYSVLSAKPPKPVLIKPSTPRWSDDERREMLKNLYKQDMENKRKRSARMASYCRYGRAA